MDQKQYEVMLADVELRLRRLRTLYDQWFHGVERIEPQIQRAELDRMITALRKQPQRNTALRFRFNQLVQRYTTFNTYWQRISRQIEEGTYKRDVLRARRRLGGRPGAREGGAQQKELELDVEVEDFDVDVDIESALAALKTEPPPGEAAAETEIRQKPRPDGAADTGAAPAAFATAEQSASSPQRTRSLRDITPFALPSQPPPGAPRAAGAPPPPAGALRKPGTLLGVKQRSPARPGGMPTGAFGGAGGNGGGSGSVSDDQMQRIFQRYVEARRQNAERTDNVRFETVAKSVRDMLPKLAQKHAGKNIEFEVVLKDGRVALKPVPK